MPMLGSFGGLAAIGRGARSGGTWVKSITSNQQAMNLRTWALAQGWDGSAEAKITVGSGVYIWSDNTATPALTTGSFPGGLLIINNGYIMGKGGNGGGAYSKGTTYTAATAGGNAISLSGNVSIDNTNGYIGGGGGGGGGSFFTVYQNSVIGGGGGAGGGSGAGYSFSSLYQAGGSGGAIGISGATPTGTIGAGGAGRIFPSARANGPSGSVSACGNGGQGGGSGAIFVRTPGGTGPATGGYGGAANESGGNGSSGGASNICTGGGGGWGQSGGAATHTTVASTDYAGAAGGKAIALNGYSVTWLSGTSQVYGAVS